MSIQSMLRRGLTFSSTNNHLPKSVLSGFRGRRPYANNANAAAAAEEPNPDGKKIRGRKLPKKEREALVESFVHEYRAMNAGKFPAPSYAHKQVGGCYYIVRRILQELKYTAKMSPSCGGAEHLSGQEKIGESGSLTEVEEDSTREMSAGASVEMSAGASVGNVSEAKNDTGLSDASDRLLESKTLSEEAITPGSGSGLVDTQSSVGKEESGEPSDMGSDKLDNGMEELKRNQSDAIAPRCEMLQGLEVVSHLCDKSKNSEAEEAQADRLDTQSNVGKGESGEASDIGPDKLDNGMEELKQNQSDTMSPRCEMLQEGLEVVSHSCDKSENSEAEEAQADQLDTEDVSKPQTEEISKDLPHRPADDAEPPKRSTLWGTMKYFANGIISIFRNQ